MMRIGSARRAMSTFVVAASLALAGCGQDASERSAPATEGVTDAMIAAGVGDEWLSYGGGYDEQRFSPLGMVNDGNVGELGLAWYADLDTARGQEATPLVHDGTLYVSTAWSMVKAYDARTGELKWSFDPEVPRKTLVRVCCDAVNRGVALYGDKVYVAALDGRLIAIDQKTGEQAWSTTVVPDEDNYAITGAPRVANGLVLIGSAGAEYRARGFIAAYDWQTGEEVWRHGRAIGGNSVVAAPYGIQSSMTLLPIWCCSVLQTLSRGIPRQMTAELAMRCTRVQ